MKGIDHTLGGDILAAHIDCLVVTHAQNSTLGTGVEAHAHGEVCDTNRR